MTGISLTELGIDPNCSKKALLYTAIDLLEKQLFYQNKASNIKHDSRTIRAELMRKLENETTGRLLDLCQKLTTLAEVHRLNSEKFRNRDSGKSSENDGYPDDF